jgi:hypothetical protein
VESADEVAEFGKGSRGSTQGEASRVDTAGSAYIGQQQRVGAEFMESSGQGACVCEVGREGGVAKDVTEAGNGLVDDGQTAGLGFDGDQAESSRVVDGTTRAS